MLRFIVIISVVALGCALLINGGRIGSIDFTDVPVLLFASVAVTAIIIYGLRRI